MAEITSTLHSVAGELQTLLNAIPVSDPRYGQVNDKYDAIYDLEQQSLGRSIAAADADYQEFTFKTGELLTQIAAAQSQIQDVAKVIDRAATVIEIAGKVAQKLAK